MKSFLLAIHDVPEPILDQYIDQWQAHAVPGNTVMTAPGETETYLYYVRQGIQKSYYLKDDKEHIVAFTYHPSFSGIPESFLTQSPSNYFLETITDSHFLRISYRKHQEYMAEYREIETLFRKLTEQLLIGVVQRYYELMGLNMEERFQTFMARSGHLLHKVPQKDLAAYLNMDPTNFSKLLNQVTY